MENIKTLQPKIIQDFIKNCSSNGYSTKETQKMNKCRHCGGSFKGIFSKVCSKCGNPKDY